MILIVPALCFLVPLVMAALGLRHGMGWIAALCVAGSLAGFSWASSGAQYPGFDGLDDEIYAFLVFGPALIGALIGTAFGWWKWRRP